MSDIQKRDRCLECGGSLEVNPKTGIPECIYCHRQYTSGAVGYEDDLQEITKQRQLREFIKAEELCEQLIKAQPESCEAHWQALLSKLGVVYVEENGKKKPTFFSCFYDNRQSILDDEHYKAAVRFAPSTDVKTYYENKAKELDELLEEFFELVRKHDKCDIFISFKHKVQYEDGQIYETNDYKKAKEIYEHLKDRYNVFFSPVSIGQDTGIQGEKYEPKILKALQSAQAMILVGFSEKNLKAQWVENEWKRYVYYIDKGNKKKQSLIYVYDKSMTLPSTLAERQLPSVDVFNAKYLDQLEKKLTFVDTTKGLMSKIGGRKRTANLEESKVDFEYAKTPGTKIIGGQGDSKGPLVKIDSSEERDLNTAHNILSHEKFRDAEKLFLNILHRNYKSYRAYYGLFMAKVKAKDEKSVPSSIINANAAYYEHLEKAIEYSPDENFSYGIIDKLIDGFKQTEDWKKQKLAFDFLVNYVNVEHSKKLHGIIKDLCVKCVKIGNIKLSEEIFECAKKILFEETKDSHIALISTYAATLLANAKYALARKYYELLVGVNSSSEAYLNLLSARLHTTNAVTARFKLIVDDSDNSSTKKPCELDLDEIFERIVICDYRERTIEKTDDSENEENKKKIAATSKMYTKICNMVLNQIHGNAKNVHTFMEIIVGCYRQLGDKKQLADIMFRLAEEFVSVNDFKRARIWYDELIIENSNDAKAHWGTLKCKLKARDDYAVAKHSKKLMGLLEFNNALNCSDNKQHAYFMSVYNKELPKLKNKSKSSADHRVDEPSSVKYITRRVVCWLLLSLGFTLAILTMKNPAVIFKNFHFGWIIAFGVILFIPAFYFTLFLYKSFKKTSSRTPLYHNGRLRMALLAHMVAVVSITVFVFGMIGSCNRVYHISEADDFALMKNVPGAGKADYILDNDIDFEGEQCKGFGAIKEFSGTFDGGGYTLKNIHISGFSSSDSNACGFVLTVTEEGEILNLNFDKCILNTAEKYVGIVAGINGGTIKNCNVNDSYVFANCTDHTFIGGIAGALAGDISSSYYEKWDYYYDDWEEVYGFGKIVGCSFTNVDDESDPYDDDDYEYALVVYDKRYRYGYTFFDDSKDTSGFYNYEKTSFTENFTYIYDDIFGIQEGDY